MQIYKYKNEKQKYNFKYTKQGHSPSCHTLFPPQLKLLLFIIAINIIIIIVRFNVISFTRNSYQILIIRGVLNSVMDLVTVGIRVVESESLKVGKSQKIGKNRI